MAQFKWDKRSAYYRLQYILFLKQCPMGNTRGGGTSPLYSTPSCIYSVPLCRIVMLLSLDSGCREVDSDTYHDLLCNWKKSQKCKKKKKVMIIRSAV